METDLKTEQLLLQKIQVLLAERRTYYAFLRTGMVIITSSLSILVFLVATSGYHGVFNHLWLAVIVVSGLLSAAFSGLVIINQSRIKLRKITKLIHNIEHKNENIADIIV